ncbi:hypothetical protein NPIL_338591 [Nephila pilipes]|uniref:Uncharacterized protein n=1 Tax=Nephila pilipes TaxID=299642 RepID=A0A8X6UTA9_NEPPI|nr:hypothetical protein NPIL_338591 [Nephila pilipes]
MVKRFQSTGSVMDVIKQRIRTALTSGKLDNIEISLGRTPGVNPYENYCQSKRYSTVQCFRLRHDLKFYLIFKGLCRNCVEVIKESDCTFMF